MINFEDNTNDNSYKLIKKLIINKAIRFHSLGNITEATKYYIFCMNQHFNDPSIYSNFGAILKNHGKLKEAEILTLKAVKMQPDYVDGIFNLSVIYEDLGRLKEAEKYLNKAIKLKPSSTNLYVQLGLLKKNNGNLEEAKKIIYKAIEINPSFHKSYLVLGNILSDLGNLEESKIHIKKAIHLNPNNTNAYNNLGIVFYKNKELKEAIIYFRKAIDLNPNYADAYNNLGVSLKDIRKLEDAEIYIRKAIDLNPNNADAYNNLGTTLNELRRFKEAEIFIKKAIEINPNSSNYYNNMSLVTKELGDLEKAKQLALRAIDLNKYSSNAYNNLGNIMKDLGKIKASENYYKKAIKLNPKNELAYYNLGRFFRDLGNSKKAEINTRKAIEINPKLSIAYNNLGAILKDLGKLKEAELVLNKAIELKPDLARAYFSLSLLKSPNYKNWSSKLFSEDIFKGKNTEEKIDIYFARANILHRENNYNGSAKYLKIANNLKMKLKPIKGNYLINKNSLYLMEKLTKNSNSKSLKEYNDNIFIVGMPRSGSTLVESIISLNEKVTDLGETDILEASYLESIKNKRCSIDQIYREKLNSIKQKTQITTNKNLNNFLYTGVIIKGIPNAKIIHCFRNPFDNILSIYKAHFSNGYEYSSSLSECAKVYLNQEELMDEFKNRFRKDIYDLNYDLLISNPNKEIKSLISWLGWEWDDKYLKPHLNDRIIYTASNIQVRSPINTKSKNGWLKYKNLLKPVISIIKNDKKINYKFL